jgi:hypothetical protein
LLEEQTARYYLDRARRRTASSPPGPARLAKNARLEIGKVAITVAQLYLSPHIAASSPGRVHRAVSPTKTDKPPTGGQWLHEIKHDGKLLCLNFP